MKPSTRLNQAEKHRAAMQKITDSLAAEIIDLLEDENVDVFYQPSDGWIVLFDSGYNAKLTSSQFDELLKMNKNEALALLKKNTL